MLSTKTKYQTMSEISPIFQNEKGGILYISGLSPIDDDENIISDIGITNIVSCLGRNFVGDAHDKHLRKNPNISVLYIPYDDTTNQNLWTPNNNSITLMKPDKRSMQELLLLYSEKPLIEVAYHFINEAMERGEKVLVHCIAGISRSVSVSAYYLMKKYGTTYSKAIEFIRDARSIANPNLSFSSQLISYQYNRDQTTKQHMNQIIKKITTGGIVKN